MKLNKIMLIASFVLALGLGAFVQINNQAFADSELSLVISDDGSNACEWDASTYGATFSVSASTGTVAFASPAFTCTFEAMATSTIDIAVPTLASTSSFGNLGVMTGTAGAFNQDGTLAGTDSWSETTVTSSFNGYSSFYTKPADQIGTMTKAFSVDVEIPAGKQAGTYNNTMTLGVS